VFGISGGVIANDQVSRPQVSWRISRRIKGGVTVVVDEVWKSLVHVVDMSRRHYFQRCERFSTLHALPKDEDSGSNYYGSTNGIAAVCITV